LKETHIKKNTHTQTLFKANHWLNFTHNENQIDVL